MNDREKKYRISLCAINTRFSQSSTAVDHLSAALSKYLDEAGIGRGEWALSVREFNLSDSFESISRTLCLENADMYAFSTYIWNYTVVSRLTAFIRLALPGALLVCGGPEVTSVCSGDAEAMAGADIAIAGEGEISFARLVAQRIRNARAGGDNRYVNPDEVATIPGIAFFAAGGGALCHSPYPAIVDDPAAIPSIYGREFARGVPRSYVYFETSRGCPNSCHYCLSSLKQPGKPAVRHIPLERVFADIDAILNDRGIERVRVIDRTFNDDPERALAIMKFIAGRAREGTWFQFEMSPYRFSGEMLEFLRDLRVKCFQFEIGIQSFDKASLDSVGRGSMGARPCDEGTGESKGLPEKNDIEGLLRFLIGRTKVDVHADLMYGLPGDTYDSCLRSFDALLSLSPHSVQFWQLKLLRGTKLRRDAEKLGLVHEHHPPYGVIRTPKMSPEDIFSLQKLGRYLDLLYNHGHISNAIKYLFTLYERPSGAFFDIISHFEAAGIAECGISRQSLFGHIERFAREKFEKDRPEAFGDILDLLRYDFILGETKRFSMPDRLKDSGPERGLEPLFRAAAAMMAESGVRYRLSKQYSVFRFVRDVFGDMSGGRPEARTAYLALKHETTADGGFTAERKAIYDNDSILALDFLAFMDKNKALPHEKTDMECGGDGAAIFESLLRGIVSLKDAGIVLENPKN